MTQPTKREQLAAMGLEEFKEHLRASGSSEQISGEARQVSRTLCVAFRDRALFLIQETQL